jgi:hypothetical protein
LIRATRAALFAVVCVGVGAAMHDAADGCHVGLLGIVLGLLAVSVLAYAGLGRERHGLTITAGLGAAQLGLHYLFGVTCAIASGGHAVAAPAMTDMPGSMAVPMPVPMPMPTPGGLRSDATAMLLAHAIAVLVSGWWLRRGERDFFSLLRAAAVLAAAPLRRLLDLAAALALTVPAPTARPRKFHRRPTSGPRPSGLPLLSSVTFRGPPAAYLAA